MTTSVYVILLAAGKGERFGAGENKCFVSLEKKSVLWHAYRAFALLDMIDGIAVMVGPDEAKRAEKALEDLIDHRFLGFIRGGETRQESVMSGLTHLSKSLATDSSLVLVHDAARCLVNKRIIVETVETARTMRAGVAPAVPISDTVRQIDAFGYIKARLDRRQLRAMQTPQAAGLDVLLFAYKEAVHRGLALTDDLSALEQIGYPVRLIDGDLANIKLTTPQDLKLASMWLEERKKSACPINVATLQSNG